MCNNHGWSLTLTNRERILFGNPCLLSESFNLPLPPTFLHPHHKILRALLSTMLYRATWTVKSRREDIKAQLCWYCREERRRGTSGKGHESFLPVLPRNFCPESETGE